MKLDVTVITVLVILLLTGCSGQATQETSRAIDVTQRQIRNGTVYQDNETDPYTGEISSYYTNGQKASEEFYVDGKKQGKSRGWHENGQLKLELLFVDGKEQGQAITWDESGQVQSEVNYVDGEVFQESDP
jgi:outer membrane biogenesis lipoprotein LolB